MARGVLVAILITLVIIMGLILLYIFLIGPSINNYIFYKQKQAVNSVFMDINDRIATYNYANLTWVNNDNQLQSLIVIKYNPPEQQA